MLVDRDENGRIIRLLETRYQHTGRAWDSGHGAYSQACTWYSTDVGRTWSHESVIPQWLGVNEVALIRAKNEAIVAACRTDNPQRFIGQLDLYSGLGISISRDNGQTWSGLNMLFEFGRHHPSLVMLPNGHILMTYAVRRGYQDTPDGFAQFGIEAILSRDNGQTWDLDHRCVLASWQGKITGPNAWWGLPQSTTTALLPDHSFLTAFGTGVRNMQNQDKCVMDLGLVKWRLD
jgi:Neuraminidase (sialidase)